MRPTLVYGLGRSGLGVVRHLERLGWPSAWWDERPRPKDVAEAASRGCERAASLEPSAYGLVIAAPGVPIDHPDLERLRLGGLEIIGEAELCYRTVPTPIIGVTGTAGKGTTTALVAHLLRGQGLDAREGGNIGTPLLDVAAGADVAVAELSSFQLERIASFRPAVAVITNLDVDHLDRHRTVATYHEAKLRLLSNLGPGDVAVLPAALRPPLADGVRVIEVEPNGGVRDFAGRVLLEQGELPPALHPQNAACGAFAALAYLERLGRAANMSALVEDLKRFTPASGRFETVGEIEGTRFIEDSIATRTIAVKAALEAAPAPVAWILGGQDKGADTGPLLAVARDKVAVILAVGRDGPRLAAAFAPIPTEIIAEPDGPRALELACEMGLERARGGSVLLAPLGASFDQFADYRARGAAFRAAVTRLAARRVAGRGVGT